MEIQQLRYFVALAETGSFTRAAEACHVSQPSLSQQIRKLEEEFRQKLVERLGRQIRLTAPGHTLLDQAKWILEEIETTHRKMAEESEGESGRISVGVIPTVAPYVLPNLLRSFRNQYPKSELTVVEDFGRALEQAAARGELDLGITSLPVQNGQLHVEPLLTEPLVLALPKRHKLAENATVRVGDIRDERFILLREEHCLAADVERFCSDHGARPKIVCRTAQLTTIQELISAGQGLSLLPAMASTSDRSRDRVYRTLSPSPTHRTVAVMWRRNHYHTRLATKFIEHLRSEAKELEGSIRGARGGK